MKTLQRSSLFISAALICICALPSAVVAKPKPQPILTTTQIAALALPSVVSITVRGDDGQVLKTGSGFVVYPGIVATNQHVVSGAHKVTVNFSDGRSESSPGFFNERTRYDIAIIECDTGNVKGLKTLINSSQVKVGDSVVAVGSPEGLNGSVTTGIISAIRNLAERSNAKVYQTTAPISHGSSGGPLMDQRGEVIGMNSFSFINGQNLNFAYASEYLGLNADDAFAKILGVKRSDYSSIITRWNNVPSLVATETALSTGDIEYFLDHGANVNATEINSGETALTLAARAGNLDGLKLLVNNGANIEAAGKYGMTSLMWAAALGETECVRFLLGNSADVNAIANGEPELGSAALNMCAQAGYTECAKLLVDNGANVNAKDNTGWTALISAAYNGKLNCVKFLIASGADVNIKSHDGNTALTLATSGKDGKSFPDVIAVLQAAGATE